MKKSIFLAIVCCLFIGGLALGQTDNADETPTKNPPQHRYYALEEVFYLKNGEVLPVQMIQQAKDDSLKIEIVSGDVITVAYDDIDREATEWRPIERLEQRLYPTPLKKHGLYNAISAYGLLGIGSDVDLEAGFGIKHIIGIQLDPHHALGVGISADILATGTGVASIFAHYRADLLKDAITPYVAMDLGLAFPFLPSCTALTNPLMASPSVGLRFTTPQRLDYTIGLGAKFQHASLVNSRVCIDNFWGGTPSGYLGFRMHVYVQAGILF